MGDSHNSVLSFHGRVREYFLPSDLVFVQFGFFFSVEVRNFGEKSQVRPPLTSDLCVEACVVIITIVM